MVLANVTDGENFSCYYLFAWFFCPGVFMLLFISFGRVFGYFMFLWWASVSYATYSLIYFRLVYKTSSLRIFCIVSHLILQALKEYQSRVYLTSRFFVCFALVYAFYSLIHGPGSLALHFASIPGCSLLLRSVCCCSFDPFARKSSSFWFYSMFLLAFIWLQCRTHSVFQNIPKLVQTE